MHVFINEMEVMFLVSCVVWFFITLRHGSRKIPLYFEANPNHAKIGGSFQINFYGGVYMFLFSCYCMLPYLGTG